MYQDIEKAIHILKAGGVVAIPTETVYGLAADAENITAINKIFHIKQRPTDHPVILHLSDFKQVKEWVSHISNEAFTLAHAFWPGPLTLIFKKSPKVCNAITGGQDTIGIRIPNHAVTQALLKKYGGGLVAPSANRFGRISPTTATAVYEELGDAVDFILDGGQCAIGVESTIVDVSQDQISILRPGMISALEIESVLKQSVMHKNKYVPRVSGSHVSHYAPKTPVTLLTLTELKKYLISYPCHEIGVMVLSPIETLAQIVNMPYDVKQYAHDLYQILRSLDKKNLRHILIEKVPENVAWDAVRDRLERASKK